MRSLSRILLLILFVCIWCCFSIQISADDFTNDTTLPVTDEEANSFLNAIGFRTSSEGDNDKAIECFAISEQGNVALGFQAFDEAQISVYNLEGTFLYGYRFINHGASFVVFFEGEHLSIKWSRSDYIGSFDDEGNRIRFRKDDGSKNNADAFHNDLYRPRSGNVGSLKYYTEGPWITWRSWRFVIEDNTGKQTVIYDASRTQPILWSLGVTGFIGFFAIVIYWKLKQEKNV